MEKREFPFHTIVSHRGAHEDEIYVGYLLQSRGEEAFPGSTDAALEFLDKFPDDVTPAQWETEGYIPVGIGHGEGDEHLPPGDGNGARKRENAQPHYTPSDWVAIKTLS